MSENQPQNQSMLDRFNTPILVILVLLIAAALAYLLLDQDEPVAITINPPLPTATHTPTESPTPTETLAPLEVYVTGEVVQPESRLTLPPGSRVEDAIAAAGGATDNADLSRVNLAATLLDGDQIHVPVKAVEADSADEEESAEPDAPTAEPPTPTPNTPRLVNINTATQEELETLPGIGPATAQSIIAYREENGDFESIEEITEVSGIGEATLERLRDLITVE